MRSSRLVPITVLALAAACSDPATSPMSIGAPLFLTVGQTFGTGALTNTSSLALPNGGHLQSGSVFCVVNSNLSVTCSSTGSYSINGVGNTNATATLAASFSSTIDCTNNGGKLVPVKSTPQTAPASSGPISSDKNGSLTVAPISSGAPTQSQFLNAATCPNGNWTKSLAGGSITLGSFTYTLLFAGKSTPTVSITGS